MLLIAPYHRENSVFFAKKWSFGQNPLFGDFRGIGGNCTNFVSQCVYAGACRMNYLPVFGWYYISMDERAPAWTGVNEFYRFITENEGVGPFGREVDAAETEIGDVIQLGRADGGFYHSLLAVGFDGEDVLVAAQTDDAYNRPLSTYTYEFARYLKIMGVRLPGTENKDCFEAVLNGERLFPT